MSGNGPTLDLPLILSGTMHWPGDDGRETLSITYQSGLEVRIPRLSVDDVRRVVADGLELDPQLAALTTDEITWFLGAASDGWLSRDSEGRKLADAFSSSTTGYASAMLTEDYSTIGHFMNERFHTYDAIAAEFGDEWVFDEWVPRQMCYLRAFPRGLALQFLVGNLPLAGLYSLLRGIITRNRTLAKLPSRDLVSVSALAQTIIATDPKHPIARSLSVAYWPHSDPAGDLAMEQADTICVWGGEAAVRAVKQRARPGVPVAEFGPKWSAAVIDVNACDPADAAVRLAEDACFYDQEACFNTQRAYVIGDAGAFANHLAHAMEDFARRYPLDGASPDALAHRSMTQLESQFLGLKTWSGRDWSVIVAEPGVALDHPLTRTVIVHPINSVHEVAPTLDARTQTVSVFPRRLAVEHRDLLASCGADRIVDLGWARLPRAGFTHDASYGMHPLVRLVVDERPRSEFGKYYPRPRDRDGWQADYFHGAEWFATPWFLRDPSFLTAVSGEDHA